MIRPLLVLVSCLALLAAASCATRVQDQGAWRSNYKLGEPQSAAMGSVMVERSHERWYWKQGREKDKVDWCQMETSGDPFSPQPGQAVFTDAAFMAENCKVSTFTYLGLNNTTTVHLGFSEFFNKSKTPALTQAVFQDLTNSTIVIVRNFKIEILKATPERIEFTVISDNMEPEVPAP